jgi:hypothetical protein
MFSILFCSFALQCGRNFRHLATLPDPSGKATEEWGGGGERPAGGADKLQYFS